MRKKTLIEKTEEIVAVKCSVDISLIAVSEFDICIEATSWKMSCVMKDGENIIGKEYLEITMTSNLFSFLSGSINTDVSY